MVTDSEGNQSLTVANRYYTDVYGVSDYSAVFKFSQMMNEKLKMEFSVMENPRGIARPYEDEYWQTKGWDTTDRTYINIELLWGYKNAEVNDNGTGEKPYTSFKDFLINEVSEAYYMQAEGMPYDVDEVGAHHSAIVLNNQWRIEQGLIPIKDVIGSSGTYNFSFIDNGKDREKAEVLSYNINLSEYEVIYKILISYFK